MQTTYFPEFYQQYVNTEVKTAGGFTDEPSLPPPASGSSMISSARSASSRFSYYFEHLRPRSKDFSLYEVRRKINREVLAGAQDPAKLPEHLDSLWPKSKREAERHILERQLTVNKDLAVVHTETMTVESLEKIVFGGSEEAQTGKPRLDVLIIGASVAGLRFANTLYEQHQGQESDFDLHIHLFERNFIEPRNQLIMLENAWLEFTSDPSGILNLGGNIEGTYLDVPVLHNFKSILVPAYNNLRAHSTTRRKKLDDMKPFRYLQEQHVSWNDVASVLTDVFQVKDGSPKRRPVMPIDLLVLSEKERWKQKKQKIHIAQFNRDIIEKFINTAKDKYAHRRLLLVGADGEKSVVATRGGFGMLVNNNVPFFAYGCTFTWYMPIKNKGGVFNPNQHLRAGIQSRYRCFTYVVRSSSPESETPASTGGDILGWIFYVGVQLTEAEYNSIKSEFTDSKIKSKLFKEFREEVAITSSDLPLQNARKILGDASRLANCQLTPESLVSVTTFVVQGPHWRIFKSREEKSGHVYAPPFIHKPAENVLSLLVGDAFFGSHFFSGKGVNLAVQRSIEVAHLLFQRGILKNFVKGKNDFKYDKFQEEYRKFYNKSLPQFLRSSHTSRLLSWKIPSAESLVSLQNKFKENSPENISIMHWLPVELGMRLSYDTDGIEQTLVRLLRDWLCPEMQAGELRYYPENITLHQRKLLEDAFSKDRKNQRDFYRYNFRWNLGREPHEVVWLRGSSLENKLQVQLLPCSEEEFVDGWSFRDHSLPTTEETFNEEWFSEKKHGTSSEVKKNLDLKSSVLTWYVPTNKLNEAYNLSSQNFTEFSLPLIQQNLNELMRYLQWVEKNKGFYASIFNYTSLKLGIWVEEILNRLQTFLVPVKTFKVDDFVGRVSFSPSGKWLAAIDSKDAYVSLIETSEDLKKRASFGQTYIDVTNNSISDFNWVNDSQMNILVQEKNHPETKEKYTLEKQTNDDWFFKKFEDDGFDVDNKDNTIRTTLTKKNYQYKKFEKTILKTDSLDRSITLVSPRLETSTDLLERENLSSFTIQDFDVSDDERFLCFTIWEEAAIYLLVL